MGEDIIEKEPWYKGPMKWILSLFLILIILSWLIPTYAIKLDPVPSYIPSISETFPGGNENETGNADDKSYLGLLEPTNPKIKQTANKIISLSGCQNSKVCNAKTIYYFVQKNINYVNDPVSREYFATAIETLNTGVGDCDDFSVLLSNLLQSVGIKTRFVFVPGHVYVQAYLPDAMKKYKFEDDWVNLDATCRNCEFSKITYSTVQQERRYLG